MKEIIHYAPNYPKSRCGFDFDSLNRVGMHSHTGGASTRAECYQTDWYKYDIKYKKDIVLCTGCFGEKKELSVTEVIKL